MSDPLHVSSAERGIVRVFTTDLDPEGDAAITRKNVARLLGRDIVLDPEKVEVFPASVIEALGLAQYLRDGYAIPDEALAGKAAVLDALSGLVILVPSSAFEGRAVTLDPNAALRFVGAFEEMRTAPPVRMRRSASTEGVISPDGPSPSDRAARRTLSSWIIALGALIIAAALVLFSVI
jgi:hypothetical protein